MMRRAKATVILVAIGALFLGACTVPSTSTTAKDDGGTVTTAATGSTEPSATTTQKTEPKDKSVGLNTPLMVGSIEWTVTAVKTTDVLHVDNQFIEDKTTSGAFLWVDVKIKNGKDKAVTADSSAMAVKDDQGREFKAFTDAMSYIPQDRWLFLEQVNPGMDRAGTVVFELPKDAKGLKLSVGDLDIFGSKQGLIDLGM
jgi:hypothetical protein